MIRFKIRSMCSDAEIYRDGVRTVQVEEICAHTTDYKSRFVGFNGIVRDSKTME